MAECPKCWMPMDDFSSMCIDCMPDEDDEKDDYILEQIKHPFNANDYDFTNWELYNIKILSEEEQVLEYFIETCKILTKEIYHPDPRWERWWGGGNESQWYYSTEFNNEKAKSLFYELKKYYESR